MNPSLFREFEESSAAAWKQKIQVDLNGLDYNESLLWKTTEDIVVKPFYTIDDRKELKIAAQKEPFSICQSIFIDDVKIANSLALNALKRGANAIQFIANKTFDFKALLERIDLQSTKLFFKLHFLDEEFVEKLSNITNSKNTFFQLDIIGNLAENGNWFESLSSDIQKFDTISKKTANTVCVDVSLYENAGAGIVQQLAYALAHTNEYLVQLHKDAITNIHFMISVRGNYFFEIAKLRAFKLLVQTLFKDYQHKAAHIELFVQPSARNKTIYDYNVNMLRTTSECMSAILGGSNTISNRSYDAIFHKSNEFGERISRNQLLILQEESCLQAAQNFADGSYYIDSITS